MLPDYLTGGLDSRRRDPDGARKGRIWAWILTGVSIAVAGWYSWLAVGSPEHRASREAIVGVVDWVGMAVAFSLGIHWPRPGTGGFPGNPSKRAAGAATAVLLILVGGVGLWLVSPLSAEWEPIGVGEGTRLGFVVLGAIILVAVFSRPRRPPRGPLVG